ncbi:hypothetical protein PSN45_003451 [Yamadazyma tenuis]|nr:hypothetical protein PSN45_003451 [Yamadazyma tenuis]
MVTDRIALSSIDSNSLSLRGNTSKSIPLIPAKKSRSFTTSFSNSRSNSFTTSSLNLLSSTSSVRKPSADSSSDVDIYASKLKFKLKLAVFKLNQQQGSRTKSGSFTFYNSEYLVKSPSNSSTKLISTSKAIHQLSPSIKLSRFLKTSNINTKHLVSKSVSFPVKKTFENSININLTQKSLNSLILSKSFNNNNNNSNNLKLFSIKKDSPFYSNCKIPLTLSEQKAIFSGSKISLPLATRFSEPSSALASSNSLLSFKQDPLPSINKILKTPLKLTSHTSTLTSAYNDDNDQTIDDQSFDDSLKKNNSSSPLRHFATPNSFSVAKSLLQLGSGVYN